MRSSPLQQVYERFGEGAEHSTEARKAAKDALVKAVQALVKKGDLLDDDFSEKGVERLSNRKLLRLLDLVEKVKEQFGSRGALVDKILEVEDRARDSGYRESVEALGLGALYDRFTAANKRTAKRSEARS
jgi:hypothetical protein